MFIDHLLYMLIKSITYVFSFSSPSNSMRLALLLPPSYTNEAAQTQRG